MTSRVETIRIKGGFFVHETEFALFRPNEAKKKKGEPRFSVIYGENGSGKSSIARGFYAWARNHNDEFETELLGEDGKVIELPEENFVHVFNEDFVREQVQFAQEGLETVVMFAEQIELDAQILKLSKSADALIREIEIAMKRHEFNYERKDSSSNPVTLLKELEEQLRRNWAERELQIKRGRRAANVNEALIDRIFSTTPTEANYYEAKTALERLLAELDTLHTETKILDECLRGYSLVSGVDLKIVSLLKEKVVEPVLSSRELRMLDMLKKAPEYVHQAREDFSASDIEYCPHCFQTIEENYRLELLDSLSRLLETDEATRHRSDLDAVHILSLSIDLADLRGKIDSFRKVDDDLCKQIEELAKSFNATINDVAEHFIKKSVNIYVPIYCESFGLEEIMLGLNLKIAELVTLTNEYNQKFDNLKSLQQEASRMNDMVAWFECHDAHLRYTQFLAEKTNDSSCIAQMKTKQMSIVEEIELLQVQKANIHIALELINRYLTIIFYSDKKLKLEVHGGKYVVYSNGVRIGFSSLSTGERNAIALCYFVSTLYHKKNTENMFGDRCLIVIDDPISSFDHSVKIGVYSFIRLIVSDVYYKCPNSQIAFFTHDIESLISMQRIISDVLGTLESRKALHTAYTLRDKTLRAVSKPSSYNEYSELFFRIFSYAYDPKSNAEFSLSIGNTMRKVLEAYGTFSFRKGIHDLFRDEEILNLLGDDQSKKDRFRSLMYRLVLDGESHFEERAKTISGCNFYPVFTEETKQKTAMELIVFMYLVDKQHVIAHLKSSHEKEFPQYLCEIERWVADLFPR